MNYLADKSYLAVKPQATANTPVIPTVFIPLISESVRVNPNFSADRRMKGIDWKSNELLKGARMIEGEISVYADPDALSHLLNMVYAKGATTGDVASGFTHPFEPGDGKSYSIEISRGSYAQRIFGVRGDNLKISFQDNKMVAALNIKALGQFYSASLAVALTGGGMTSLVLSTDYDLRPADGLVAGDKIEVGGVEITITSINADGKTVNFGAISVTASIGDTVYLKAQTPSFGEQAEPLYLGNTLVGIGADESAATTASASRATATPCYNASIDLKNNLLDQPASGATGPSVILNQVKEAQITLSRLFENPTQYQKWIENIKRAITLVATGRFIDTGLTISEKLTIKAYKVKALTNEEALNTGEYIFDNQNFEALYDDDADESITVSIINNTSGDELGDEDES